MARETVLTCSRGNHCIYYCIYESYFCYTQDGKMEVQVEAGKRGETGMDITKNIISGER